ncbi:MAG: hypothetical protein QOH10_1548 [Actinomycetota bacterium]|jgi:hypothetical protein|nr:hypothetical protein [Actinomycetota bacterium]
MADAGFVLVASPFTGPFAWSRVAEVLRGRGLRAAVHGTDEPIEPPIVLVGHSGGGSHLPAIADQLGGVQRAVYVDALLPHPGRSWAQTVPHDFLARLESQAVSGRLPPWSEWWGDDAMRMLLPDDALRARFVADCPRVPVAFLHEVMTDVPDPPSAYVQLSAAYETETTVARDRGWPTVVLDLHHLAILTDPEAVTDALLRV